MNRSRVAGFTAKHVDSASPAPEQAPANVNPLEEIAEQIGKLVAEKNEAYGSAFEAAGPFLRILFPNGVHPTRYEDMLLVVRIFDKQMRIATRKTAFGESPYRDIAGYGVLGTKKDLRFEKGPEEKTCSPQPGERIYI